MRSALELVAFSGGCNLTGTVALLETARKALDRAGHQVAAANVDMALSLFLVKTERDQDDRYMDITHHG